MSVSSFSRRLAVAAACICAGVSAAHADGPVYVNQASSLVYWGSSGNSAVMILRYDNSGSVPVRVSNLRIADAYGNDITNALFNCGTIVKTGDTFVGHQIMPGQDCFLYAPRSGSGVSIRGTATLTDSTGATTNIASYVRTMLEVRDSSGNVLTHAEFR